MNVLIGKTIAVTLIAGLLILASVENHASEIDSYLDNTMRTQVLEELKENVQRLYQDTPLVPTEVGQRARAGSPSFPVADRGAADVGWRRIGVWN